MTYTYNCYDQQIINWHYRTVCRYQLAVKPATASFTANLLKRITNKAKFSKFLKPQKVQKYHLPWQIKTKTAHSNLNELSPFSLEQGFIQEVITLLPTFRRFHLKRSYASHVQFWRHINNLTLHITSGKLLSDIELYPSFFIAFCCFGNQAPQIIRSKRAVAEFSVIKGAIIGARNHLQKQNKLYFLYKWAFIAAGLSFIEYSSSGSKCLGVHNVFIFPELDKYNYYLFEPLGGLDLTFNTKTRLDEALRKKKFLKTY